MSNFLPHITYLFGCIMWHGGILVPWLEFNLGLLQWKHRIVTTGPPSKSQMILFYQTQIWFQKERSMFVSLRVFMNTLAFKGKERRKEEDVRIGGKIDKEFWDVGNFLQLQRLGNGFLELIGIRHLKKA